MSSGGTTGTTATFLLDRDTHYRKEAQAYHYRRLVILSFTHHDFEVASTRWIVENRPYFISGYT